MVPVLPGGKEDVGSYNKVTLDLLGVSITSHSSYREHVLCASFSFNPRAKLLSHFTDMEAKREASNW